MVLSGSLELSMIDPLPDVLTPEFLLSQAGVIQLYGPGAESFMRSICHASKRVPSWNQKMSFLNVHLRKEVLNRMLSLMDSPWRDGFIYVVGDTPDIWECEPLMEATENYHVPLFVLGSHWWSVAELSIEVGTDYLYAGRTLNGNPYKSTKYESPDGVTWYLPDPLAYL